MPFNPVLSLSLRPGPIRTPIHTMLAGKLAKMFGTLVNGTPNTK